MITVSSLITVEVYHKDITSMLYEKNVKDIDDSNWLFFLKNYWENDDCYVKSCWMTHQYKYEYFGHQKFLIMTPLTDRCFRSLLSAFQLNLAGSAIGPAGVGKF